MGRVVTDLRTYSGYDTGSQEPAVEVIVAVAVILALIALIASIAGAESRDGFDRSFR